jgi:hypothetical protein
MTATSAEGSDQDPTEEWSRYGRTLLHSMAEVLEEAPEAAHNLLLEAADYWLSLGLALGTDRPQDAARLLLLIETEEHNRAELLIDAASFVTEALP